MAIPLPPEAFTAWTAGSSGGPAAPTVTGGFTDPDGGTNAYKIDFPAVASGSSYLATPLRFGVYDTAERLPNTATTFSVWLKADATSVTNMWVHDGAVAYGLVKQITVTTSWQRFTFTVNSQATTRRCSLGCSLSVPGSVPISAQTLYAYHATVNTATPDVLGNLQSFYSFDGNTDDSVGSNGMSPLMPNLTSDLVGYWTLDGNANDSTGTNNGTGVNLGSYVAGKLGQCATFNGTNSRIEVANPANFRAATFTVSAWVKTSSAARQEIFQSWDQSGGTYNGFELAADAGNLVVTWGTGGTFTYFNSSGASVSDGNWHHVVITYDSLKLRFYIDGVSRGTMSASALVYSSNTRVRIGIDEYVPATFAYPFNGNIDEVGFWSSAKDFLSIDALYNAGAGKAYPFTATPTPLTYTTGVTAKQAARFNLQPLIVSNPANFRKTEFSVAGWIRTRPLAGYQHLFCSWYDATLAGFQVRINPSGRLEFVLGNNGGGNYVAETVTAVADGMWHHIALAYSNNRADVRIYVDGIEELGVNTSILTFNVLTVSTFGCVSGGLGTLVGDVQNWGYWSRPIALQEVQALYNFGAGLDYPFGGGSVSNPPEITNLTPTVGSRVTVNTPLGFDVTDDNNDFRRIIVVAEFPASKIREVVYDGNGFGPMYQNSSNTATPITDGYRFRVVRDGGWIDGDGPVLTPFAIDVDGGENA